EASEALARRLDAGGYAHSVAVAETAAGLATVYGVDAESAYLAGLLHDWARDDAPDTLLAEAARLGVEVTSVDRAVPYLLHARTGAAAVGEWFTWLSPDVINAISRHTLGSPDMSDLDAVVYLADAIEPGRDSAAAEGLRALVGTVPLFDLYGRAYAHSLERLVRERRRIHPGTVDAWNAIIGAKH
ncbi:MAG TPA: bis(5'-nucleosyl)-tetraphosphatase (symmetrical) YqeK, partial [Coriobacteriia bacterium]|nr:bis(5'-nucleosyl)-tetraphosphatase (symmetrical) YqeK [Coriobacteriia bacterium]